MKYPENLIEATEQLLNHLTLQAMFLECAAEANMQLEERYLIALSDLLDLLVEDMEKQLAIERRQKEVGHEG